MCQVLFRSATVSTETIRCCRGGQWRRPGSDLDVARQNNPQPAGWRRDYLGFRFTRDKLKSMETAGERRTASRVAPLTSDDETVMVMSAITILRQNSSTSAKLGCSYTLSSG